MRTTVISTEVGPVARRLCLVTPVLLRGMGASTRRLHVKVLQQLAVAVGALLVQVGDLSAHPLGHGLGGMVVVQALLEGLLAKRLDGVVNFGSPAPVDISR